MGYTLAKCYMQLQSLASGLNFRIYRLTAAVVAEKKKAPINLSGKHRLYSHLFEPHREKFPNGSNTNQAAQYGTEHG